MITQNAIDIAVGIGLFCAAVVGFVTLLSLLNSIIKEPKLWLQLAAGAVVAVAAGLAGVFIMIAVVGSAIGYSLEGVEWFADTYPVAATFAGYLLVYLVIAAVVFNIIRWVVSEVRRYRAIYTERRASCNGGES